MELTNTYSGNDTRLYYGLMCGYKSKLNSKTGFNGLKEIYYFNNPYFSSIIRQIIRSRMDFQDFSYIFYVAMEGCQY